MSSNEIILSIENLGKKFEIYENPRDRLAEIVANPLRRAFRRPEKKYHREFWALRDISFEVGKGETVGIIGRNGAGKSTLLQIITGTLGATEGKVRRAGRISALLELGAGFNPEFTGLDNIFLNSAILGLTEAETRNCLDDIIAFADIGDFIQQPVKTYSSGMYVRLAFSVAIHVKPELLIIDEALAVGDAVFQSKCMNRLRNMVEDGVSLLFVSHDIGAVKALCKRALLLEKGAQLAWGETAEVSNEYTRLVHEKKIKDAVIDLEKPPLGRIGDSKAEFLAIELTDTHGAVRNSFSQGETMKVRCTVRANKNLVALGFGIHVRDRTGIDISYVDNLLEDHMLTNIKAGDLYRIEWSVPIHFARGRYDLAAVVSSPAVEESDHELLSSDLILADFLPLAAQFTVVGDWDIYASLRFGSLDKAELLGGLSNQTADQSTLAQIEQQNLDAARNVSRLHLGCGTHILDGWANVDLLLSPDIYRWDLSRPLPLPENSVEYIFCEHFLEHLDKRDAAQLLSECFRVLKPSGVLRLSTPSLEFLVECYRAQDLTQWRDIGWTTKNTADLVNEGMRSWGRQYIYDRPALEEALVAVGFGNVTEVKWGVSSHAALCNLENRPFHEELIYEAVK